MIQGDTLVPLPLAVRLFKQWTPRNWNFPQESPSGGSERLKPTEEPGSQEKISQDSNSFSAHIARDCGRVGPHFNTA